VSYGFAVVSAIFFWIVFVCIGFFAAAFGVYGVGFVVFFFIAKTETAGLNAFVIFFATAIRYGAKYAILYSVAIGFTILFLWVKHNQIAQIEFGIFSATECYLMRIFFDVS